MQVIHRDLKSENLILSEPGRAADIRIADFGLTKLASASLHASAPAGLCTVLHHRLTVLGTLVVQHVARFKT